MHSTYSSSSPHQLNSELAVIGIDSGKNLSAGLVRRQMKFWSLKMCQSLGTGACGTPPSAAIAKPFISQV